MLRIEDVFIFGFRSLISKVYELSDNKFSSDSEFNVDCAVCDNPYYNCDNCPMALYDNITLLSPKDIKHIKELSKNPYYKEKLLSRVHINFEITAPVYWWMEYSEYDPDMAISNTSLLLSVLKDEVALEDFSIEDICSTEAMQSASNLDNHIVLLPKQVLEINIDLLNTLREKALDSLASEGYGSIHAKQIISMIPSSYNIKSAIGISYGTLSKIYRDKKDSKNREWQQMIDWIESLPYFTLIKGVK